MDKINESSDTLKKFYNENHKRDEHGRIVERDYTGDEREQCSNCKRRIEPNEKIWRTLDHAELPPPGLYKGKKAKKMIIDITLLKAIYCTDCTSKFDKVLDRINRPHQCKCDNVSRCSIFIHPSEKIQSILNSLMDAMAEFDDLTKSESTLIFKSIHPNGIFISTTKQSNEK